MFNGSGDPDNIMHNFLFANVRESFLNGTAWQVNSMVNWGCEASKSWREHCVFNISTFSSVKNTTIWSPRYERGFGIDVPEMLVGYDNSVGDGELGM